MPRDGTYGRDDVLVLLTDRSSAPDAAFNPSWDSLPPAEDLKQAAQDAGPTHNPDATGTTHLRDGQGCSCRVGAGHDGFAGFAMVALGLAFVLRTRRRHSPQVRRPKCGDEVQPIHQYFPGRKRDVGTSPTYE